MKYLVYNNVMGKWIQSPVSPLFTSNIEYAYDFGKRDFAENWIKGKTYLSLSIVEVSRIKTFKGRPTK